MNDSRRLIRIFLGSPGDLIPERQSAKAAIEELNQSLGHRLACQLELVGWEQTITKFGRPQEVINGDLDKCELFVGMMWRRWGTPPSKTGPYTSGFEEEFRLSMTRRIKEGRPAVCLFFKDVDEELLRDPGEDLSKVIAFKEQLIEQKEIFFQTFAGIRDFETKFRLAVTDYVFEAIGQEKTLASRKEQSEPTQRKKAKKKTPDKAAGLLSSQARAFIAQFLSKAKGTEKAKAFEAFEVARFRLIATVSAQQGNDERILGVHDANLLFLNMTNAQLGNDEVSGLVSTALAHVSDENVPIGKWLKTRDGVRLSWISYFTIEPSRPSIAIGALKLMRLLKEPVPEPPTITRDFFVKAWLEEGVESAARTAALQYLGELGIEGDLPTIRSEFDRNDSSTVKAAAEAIIRIKLRGGRIDAVKALYELQSSAVDSGLIRDVFKEPGDIPSEILKAGLGHKVDLVRQVVLRELSSRKALDAAAVETMLEDSDATVRFLAFKNLLASGRRFSDTEVREILVKSAASGLGALSRPLRKSDGSQFVAQYEKEKLRAQSTDELVASLLDFMPLDDEYPVLILAERDFGRFGDLLRSAIDNDFAAEFAGAMARLESNTHVGEDLLIRTRKLGDSARVQLLEKAIEILAKIADPADLTRIRTVAQKTSTNYVPDVIDYLGKHGEFEDVSNIVSMLDRPGPERAQSLLFPEAGRRYDRAASALLGIADGSFEKLLSHEIPQPLLARILARLPATAIRALDDAALLKLLTIDDESVRKVCALRVVSALSRTRARAIFGEYVSKHTDVYYNVLFWLDIGTIVPKDRVASLSRTALSDLMTRL